MQGQKKKRVKWFYVLNVNYFVRFATITLSAFLHPILTDFHALFHH